MFNIFHIMGKQSDKITSFWHKGLNSLLFTFHHNNLHLFKGYAICYQTWLVLFNT